MTDHAPGETPLTELEALARITPADVERARAAWTEHARPGAKELLSAEPIPAKKPKRMPLGETNEH